MSGDWHDRVLAAAQRDRKLVKKLRKIQKLERKLIGGSNVGGVTVIQVDKEAAKMETKKFQKANREYNEIIDQIALGLAEKGENPDEFAQWLSYNYENILHSLE